MERAWSLDTACSEYKPCVHTRTRSTFVGVSWLVGSQDKGREALNVAMKWGREKGWLFAAAPVCHASPNLGLFV